MVHTERHGQAKAGHSVSVKLQGVSVLHVRYLPFLTCAHLSALSLVVVASKVLFYSGVIFPQHLVVL